MNLSDVATKYIVAVDEAELIVRMIEAHVEMRRPAGKTARQVLDNHTEPDARAAWQRSARAAMEFWRECIEGAQRPS
jgi:hypothetical protein